MKRSGLVASVVLGGQLAWAAPALAQTPAPNAGDGLTTLIGLGAGDGTALVPIVVNLVRTEISTFPTASSSAGFAFGFDPALGVPARTTRSFGPLFVERPQTAGRGKWGASLDFQHTTWRSLDGIDLKTGGLRTQDGNSGFSQSFIDLRSSIAVFAVTAGLSDRIDVGVSVPYVTTSVTGTYTAFDGHFAGSMDATSHGIGDITVRAKARLMARSRVDMAVVAEEHLPTGDPVKLLGLGTATEKFLFIAEEHGDKVSHHLNIGYTFAGSGAPVEPSGGFDFQAPFKPSDEINYSGGVDVAVTPKLSITGDVIARVLRHSVEIQRITNGSAIFIDYVPAATQSLLVGVVSAKINLAGQWLIRANVLFPLTDNGLEPGITPVIGFERAF